MLLGEYIKNYRASHGDISQRTFAKMSGISCGYISMLENNVNPRTGLPISPTIDMYQKVAAATGVSLNELFATVESPVDLSVPNDPLLYFTQSFPPLKAAEIGNRIRARREELGLTPKEVAKRAHLPLSTLNRYERGEFERIDIGVTNALSKVLAISHDYLVCKTDDPFYFDWGETLHRALSQPQDANVIRIVGRDGSIIEQEVTDEQMSLFKSMLNQFRPVSDENI